MFSPLINTPLIANLIDTISVATPPFPIAFALAPFDPSAAATYKAHLDDVTHRRAIATWFREIPVVPAMDTYGLTNTALWQGYEAYLHKTRTPKLLVVAHPGLAIREAQLPEIRARYGQNGSLDVADVGPGTHFLLEDSGEAVGSAISAWAKSKRLDRPTRVGPR